MNETNYKNCPPEGEFYAWRKCEGGIIVKVLVPETAKRKELSGSIASDEIEVIGFYNFAGEEMPGICGGHIRTSWETHDTVLLKKGQLMTFKEPQIYFFTSFWDALCN